jgi:hypothetical protein
MHLLRERESDSVNFVMHILRERERDVTFVMHMLRERESDSVTFCDAYVAGTGE